MTPSRPIHRPVMHGVGVACVLLGAAGADSRVVWVPAGLIVLGLVLIGGSYMGVRGMGRCRACKAEIAWVPTQRGKWMPVDAKPYFVVRELPRGWKGQRAAVVTDDGAVVWGIIIGQDDSLREAAEIARLVGGTVGRRPHWASCPDAARFSERKGAARRGGGTARAVVGGAGDR